MNVSNVYSYDILFLDTLYSTRERVNLQNNSFVIFFFSREGKQKFLQFGAKFVIIFVVYILLLGVFFGMR